MAYSKDSKKVEFTPPEGFTPPEHKGDEFDLVCTFRVKEGGTICLIKLGETNMPGYEHDEGGEHEDSEHKPSYGEYTKGMTSMMPSMGGNPGMGGGY
jgi:hypothetical protein